MGKLETIQRTIGANIADSTGGGRAAAGHSPAPSPAKAAANPRWDGTERIKDAMLIPLGSIIADPDQPRAEFDPESLQRLADSMSAKGQLQNARVRWDQGRGAYVILIGERRWRAAALAGLTHLSCVVHQAPLAAEEVLEVQLIENALRDDLKPVEQARAFRRLIDARGYSLREAAKALHIGTASVQRALALLDLPAPVQAEVDRGALAATTAAEIASLDTAEEQSAVAAAAIREGLTRPEVEEIIRSVKTRRPAPEAKPSPVTFTLAEGCTVTIRWRKANGLDAAKVVRLLLRQLQGKATDAV